MLQNRRHGNTTMLRQRRVSASALITTEFSPCPAPGRPSRATTALRYSELSVVPGRRGKVLAGWCKCRRSFLLIHCAFSHRTCGFGILVRTEGTDPTPSALYSNWRRWKRRHGLPTGCRGSRRHRGGVLMTPRICRENAPQPAPDSCNAAT